MTSLIFFAIAIPILGFIAICNQALTEQFGASDGSTDTQGLLGE